MNFIEAVKEIEKGKIAKLISNCITQRSCLRIKMFKPKDNNLYYEVNDGGDIWFVFTPDTYHILSNDWEIEEEHKETKTTNLTLGEALELCKQGYKITWEHWGITACYIYMSDSFGGILIEKFEENSTPWTPSQRQLLTGTWEAFK